MKILTEKCSKCEKEFEVDSEALYWHLMIHKTKEFTPNYIPNYPNYIVPPVNITPPCHYHNGSPCYNNPCYWC